MTEKKRRPGRPPWTAEQREQYHRTIAQRAERKAEEEAEKPARRSNGPMVLGVGQSPEDREMVSKLLKEAIVAYKMPKPKDDAELEKRIEDYFVYCGEQGVIPTVEEICMYIGYSKEWVYKTRTGSRPGYSPRTKDILNRMLEVMAVMDAKLAMTGKIRDAVYIFRSKNFHGMKDQQEVVVGTNLSNDVEVSKDELENFFMLEQTFPEDEPSSTESSS